MKIEPFEIHYNQTRALWTKETSDNCLLACVQKVCFVVAAAFAVVYETLRNACSLVGNKTIEYCYTEKRKIALVLCLNEQLGEDAPASLRALALAITSKEPIHDDITITAADFRTIRSEFHKKNLTLADINQLVNKRLSSQNDGIRAPL